MTNEYHFITNWRVKGTTAEIYDIISEPLEYPRWWPSVYLQTQEIEHGNQDGIGRRISLYTKGWLPYTLRWESSSTETKRPERLAIRAEGDFNGRGIWALEQDGDFVNVTFDWKLTADKPLLRYLSFLLKPAFSANHRWAMERGRESLELEIARRHAPAPEERNRIPAPPQPNRTSGVWLGLGVIVVVGMVILLFRSR